MPRPSSLPAGNTSHAHWDDLTHAWTFHATGNTGGADADDIKGSNDATQSGGSLSDTVGFDSGSGSDQMQITSVTSSDAVTYMYRAKLDADDNKGMIAGLSSDTGEYIWHGKGDTSIESNLGNGSSRTMPTGHRTVLYDICISYAAESGSLHACKIHYKLATASTWTNAATDGNDSSLADRAIDRLGWGFGDSLALVGELHYFYIFDGTELTLANLDDDFADPYDIVEPPENIVLTAQAANTRVKRKKASGTYSWTIAGTYGGTPTAIEYRRTTVGDGAGGSSAGTWATLDASPSGGTFSEVVNLDATVPWQGLEVRFSNDTDISDSDTLPCTVDAVYLLEVDSIADGRLTNAKSHTGRTWTWMACNGSGVDWQQLTDSHIGANDGSHWPILADRLCDDILAAVIPSGSSGQKMTGLRNTAVTSLVNNGNTTGTGTGDIDGILMHGGANDSTGTSPSDTTTASETAWETECEALADSFQGAYTDCKTYFSNLGECTAADTDARVTRIRKGFNLAIDSNSNSYQGANIWWIEHTSDGLHPVTDAEGEAYANEWWHVLRTGATAAPAIVQATHNTGKTVVTVQFDKSLRTGTTISPDCFTVYDDAVAATISSAAVSGVNVALTLSTAASGTLTVSMGEGESPHAGTGEEPPQGAGVSLPNSAGTFYPAALPFFDEAVAAADDVPPAFASAQIPTGGTTVVVTLTEAGTPPVLPQAAITGFSLSSDGDALSILATERTGNTEITLTTNRPVLSTETVTVSYSSGNVTDSAPSPNSMADFSNQAITNNSTQSSGGGSTFAVTQGLQAIGLGVN